MNTLRLLIALLVFTSASLATADDVELFRRLGTSKHRVARAQQDDGETSDSFPTQYMDPDDLDDRSTELDDRGAPLFEQEVVPAEPVPSSSADLPQAGGDAEFYGGEGAIVEGHITDPVLSDVGVACGCGEGGAQESWGPSECYGSTTCCRCPRRYDGGSCDSQAGCGLCCGGNGCQCGGNCRQVCRGGQLLRHIRGCR